MSSTDLPTDVSGRRTDHASVWALALAAVLLAVSFGHRRSTAATVPKGDPTPSEAGRGGGADTPSGFSRTGWKNTLLRVYRGISEDRILLVSAGVTFYLLLSIFPGIAALFSIYGLFANPAEIAAHLDTLADVAPGGAIDVLREEMTRLASQGGTTLGISFLVGFSISLWTANTGVSAIFDALNIVYAEKESEVQILFNDAHFYLGVYRVHSPGDRNSRAVAGRIELPAVAGRHRRAGENRTLANSFCTDRIGAGCALQIWCQPHSGALALGHLG